METKEIIELSNKLICQNIGEYFPGGTTDSRGWYTLKNHMRGESEPGSFGINLDTGACKDFADDDYSGDVTGVYAYNNGTKNIAAAKDIIKRHAPQKYDEIFPDKKPGRVSRTPIVPIPEHVYTQDFEDYCNGDTRLKDNIDFIYEYRDTAGKLLYISCRLKTPFTDKKGNARKLLSVGYFEHTKNDETWKDFSWYEHPFKGKPYPFSRQDKLANAGNSNIIIVEGEKAAYYLESVLPSKRWIVTCNGASSYMKNAKAYEIFQKLKINHVFFWPDNDKPGKELIGFIRERFDKVSVVKIPENEFPEGWDAADAVLDGWTADKIEAFIFDNLYTDQEIDPQYFKALSHDHENFYFVLYRLGIVKSAKMETLTKGFLRILAPLEYWSNKYPSRENSYESYNLEAASEDLVEIALKTPYHESGKIRQIGAWKDDDRYVFHYGTGLLYGKKRLQLFDFESNNIYEKKGYLSFVEKDWEKPDLRKLGKIINRFSIATPTEKYQFLGWILVAMIGGALDWRPHIWLTGETGSGKSAAIKFLLQIFDTCSILETGMSSEAGIRQRLKVSTLPVLIDEMEEMDDSTTKNLKGIKALIRIASTGGRISKGTADHSGVDFSIQSCFCVGSISPQIAEGADQTRFSLINFDKELQGTPEDWTKTEDMMNEILAPDYTSALKWYFATHIYEIVETTKMAFSIFSDRGVKSRIAQQYSPLAAGAYIFQRNGVEDIEKEKFREFIEGFFNLEEQGQNINRTDADRCMSKILQTIIPYKDRDGYRDQTSIYELIKTWIQEKDKVHVDNRDSTYLDNIIKTVKNYGFLLDHELCDGKVLFVYNAHQPRKILENSPWSGDVREILRRHPKADNRLTPTVYAGGNGAAIRFDYSMFDDNALPEYGDEIPF